MSFKKFLTGLLGKQSFGKPTGSFSFEFDDVIVFLVAEEFVVVDKSNLLFRMSVLKRGRGKGEEAESPGKRRDKGRRVSVAEKRRSINEERARTT